MINPQELFDKAMTAAEDWADKDEAADNLDDAVDALKGLIFSELKAKGESVTLIPVLAKKDERYVELQKDYLAAKKEAIIAKLKYDQINRFMDNVRTKESTERALAR